MRRHCNLPLSGATILFIVGKLCQSMAFEFQNHVLLPFILHFIFTSLALRSLRKCITRVMQVYVGTYVCMCLCMCMCGQFIIISVSLFLAVTQGAYGLVYHFRLLCSHKNCGLMKLLSQFPFSKCPLYFLNFSMVFGLIFFGKEISEMKFCNPISVIENIFYIKLRILHLKRKNQKIAFTGCFTTCIRLSA